jgi:hypothetical protein
MAKITKHRKQAEAKSKAELTAEEISWRRGLETLRLLRAPTPAEAAMRRGLAPRSAYELEASLLDLKRRVEALERGGGRLQ